MSDQWEKLGRALLKTASNPGGGKGKAGDAVAVLILGTYVEKIIDIVKKRIEESVIALAKREWKQIVLRERKKEYKGKGLGLRDALDVVDDVLADADGAAGWMPSEISDEMSRQFYHALDKACWPKSGRSVRGRFVQNEPGRPSTGVSRGILCYKRTSRGA